MLLSHETEVVYVENCAGIIAESAGDAETWTARMEAWDEKIALLSVETEDGYPANDWPLTEKNKVGIDAGSDAGTCACRECRPFWQKSIYHKLDMGS